MELQINGRAYQVEAEPGTPLLTVLRDHLDLIGTKYGCGESECGACTVLLDGTAHHSCITPVSLAAGKKITTIEGLAQDGKLHPLQQAFMDEGAWQCGYCTPGMIMAAHALLRRSAHPSEREIVQAMNGNLCRCGTYPRIVAAIQRAAAAMAAAGKEA